jgi:hypothetical protein
MPACIHLLHLRKSAHVFWDSEVIQWYNSQIRIHRISAFFVSSRSNTIVIFNLEFHVFLPFHIELSQKLLSLAFAMEWEENKILEPRPPFLHVLYTLNWPTLLSFFSPCNCLPLFFGKGEIAHELSYLVYSGVFTELLQQMQLKGLQVSNQLSSLYESMFLLKVDG